LGSGAGGKEEKKEEGATEYGRVRLRQSPVPPLVCMFIN
jgi:hypothetical protein